MTKNIGGFGNILKKRAGLKKQALLQDKRKYLKRGKWFINLSSILFIIIWNSFILKMSQAADEPLTYIYNTFKNN